MVSRPLLLRAIKWTGDLGLVLIVGFVSNWLSEWTDSMNTGWASAATYACAFALFGYAASAWSRPIALAASLGVGLYILRQFRLLEVGCHPGITCISFGPPQIAGLLEGAAVGGALFGVLTDRLIRRWKSTSKVLAAGHQ